MKLTWPFLLLFLCIGQCTALPVDTGHVYAVDFPAGTLQELSADEELQYGEDQFDQPEESWFERWLRKLFATDSSATVWEVIFWTVVIVCAAAGIYMIFRSTFTSMVTGKPVKHNPFSIADAEEMQQDPGRMAQEAAAAGNFRAAIRYQFLYLLKELSDHDLIHWIPGKTNDSYLKELRNNSLYDQVAFTFLIFEYVWYGDHPANQSTWTSFSQQSGETIRSIHEKISAA